MANESNNTAPSIEIISYWSPDARYVIHGSEVNDPRMNYWVASFKVLERASQGVQLLLDSKPALEMWWDSYTVNWHPESRRVALAVSAPDGYPYLILDLPRRKLTFIPLMGGINVRIGWETESIVRFVDSTRGKVAGFLDIEGQTFDLSRVPWYPFAEFQKANEAYNQGKFGKRLDKTD